VNKDLDKDNFYHITVHFIHWWSLCDCKLSSLFFVSILWILWNFHSSNVHAHVEMAFNVSIDECVIKCIYKKISDQNITLLPTCYSLKCTCLDFRFVISKYIINSVNPLNWLRVLFFLWIVRYNSKPFLYFKSLLW